MGLLTTTTRDLLCLSLVVSLLLSHKCHLVQCNNNARLSSHLFISTPSSGLVERNTLHTFQPSSSFYRLVHHPNDCPRDVFALEGPGNTSLVVTSNVTLDEGTAIPTCIRDASSAAEFLSIRIYRCFAVMDDTVGVPFTVVVQPEFLSSGLTFHRTFYSGSVVEGLANSTVSTPELVATAQPRENLLLASYRVTGPFSHLFHVRVLQTACTTHPLLVATEPLDRETLDYYQVTLEAYALHAPSLITASTTVGISVLDENDNPPVFSASPSQPSRVTVDSKRRPGTGITQYNATDVDLGINGETRFSVSNTNTTFTIHPLSGVVYPFQAPAVSHTQILSIQARDQGSPAQSALASLSLFITSANATSPRITIHGLEQPSTQQQLGDLIVRVPELAAVGDLVTTIEIVDQDSTDLSLMLLNVGPCECFNISEPTFTTNGLLYMLMVADALDFELNPGGRYRLTLTASDRSSVPPLTSNLELQVMVTDENEPPYFVSGHYNISVMEGIPIGTNVAQLLASDPDGGMNGNLSYTLLEPSNTFEIDSELALIYTLTEIDFESVSSPQIITVRAEDGGGLYTMATLTITVLDRNDNPPSLLASSIDQSVTIREDHPHDQPIFQFVAVDEDMGCNGAVDYSIVHADPDVFSLDASSGLLYPSSNTALDFESFEVAVVVIQVTDLGLEVNFTVETTLYVSLTDVNDEVPVIDPIRCPCFISENVPPSSPEAKCPPLSSYDPDVESSVLTYDIATGNIVLFQIDSNTGVVSTRSSLDREVSTTHQLEITVSDGLHISAPMLLNVTVIDANDNPPSYSGTTITLTMVPADLDPGDFVGGVAATDPDIGYNALTNYQINSASSVVMDTFRLDPLSGMLYTRTVLPSPPTTYSFQVSAHDQLQPTATPAMVTVTLQIAGMKNNPPSFALTTDHRTIAEDFRVGSSVVQFMASDNDSGDNGRLTYTLVEGSGNHSNLFQLQSNGLLTLADTLSGRAGNVYTLNVSVCDGGSVPLKDYQLFVVTVYPHTSLVYNPHIPVCHFNGSVVERLDNAQVITQLPPMQDTANIRYSIVSGEASIAFQIAGSSLEALSGFPNVFSQTVFITLLAEYSPNFHPCSVTVAIQDINNSPPVFSADMPYLFEVYRGTPMGSAIYQVIASDADVGSNARTNYAISNSDQVPFQIDTRTGSISVSGGLDQLSYSITVTATDQLSPAMSATITVTAVVLAIPNSVPIFGPLLPSPLPVAETTRGLVAAAQISDNDGDSNKQAVNFFCIASGNLRGAFRIATEGGELTGSEGLDYETLPANFNLTLMAYDSSLNPAFGTTVITVALVDENEAPAFTLPVYRANVREGGENNMLVINVTAVDEDAGTNGIVRYSIPGSLPFSIDPQTGSISTAGNLNRENMREIAFNVTASDGGNPSRLSTAEVQITITDVNNFRPMFVTATMFTVPEDVIVGVEIVGLMATDRDSGVNGLLQFTLTGGDDSRQFSLDPWTGSLTLSRGLDFELGPTQYILNFLVRDLGTPSLSSTLTLIITVTDSNEHYPIFSSQEYECNISENANAFQETCHVSATDADGSGNQVMFSLTGSPLFTIDSNTGVISSTRIPSEDRTDNPTYVLQVQATDTDPVGTRSSNTIVVVNIIETNDVPVFSEPQSFVFYEGAPVNTLLFFAHAHDMDVTANFSTVTYGILQDTSNLFRLERQTGAVFLDGALDYEAISSPLSVRFIGTNSELDSAPSSSRVYTINIADVNENVLPPVFHPDFNPLAVWLSRASPVGTHVISLNASDPENQIIKYDITGGSGHGYFQIDPNSGNITTTFSLASIGDLQVTLEIRALDSVTHPLPAWHELTVTLSSEYSFKPFFTRPVFEARPSEGARAMDVVAAVRAEVDGQVDTSTCYTITSGNPDQTFTIDQQSGAVSLTNSGVLDRELRSLYNLTVTAEDPGRPDMSSLALVVIDLEDDNDYRPNLENVNFNFTIFDMYPVSASEPVARVFAVDNDIGENGRLTYSMTSVPSNSSFDISNETGYLYLIRPLDRTVSFIHTLTVTARDHGTVPLTRSVTLTITVIPTLLNPPPPALNPILTLTLSENMAPGALLTTVSLHSANNGAIIIYRIAECPTVISILPNSGEVYLTGPLDAEVDEILRFNIEVLVDDNNRASASTPLTINVMDENDNRPIFNRRVYEFEMNEGVIVGSPEIGRVVATDDDRTSNLEYSLVGSMHPSSQGLFTVNSTNGFISGPVSLDCEALPSHTLTVAVTDNGTPPLLDFATIVITIQDVDDNDPHFLPSDVDIYPSEDILVEEVVYTVKAFDPDKGQNADLAYSLITVNTPFTVNSTTGEVRVEQPLDAETQLTHSLVIRAFNPNRPSSVSSMNLNLNVHVIDALDSSPDLELPNQPMAMVRENYPPYTRVTQIQSPTSTRQVYYSILEGNHLGHFLVEPLTGVVRTTTPLNREEAASYQLLIQGAFGIGFESNITLFISVTDANDKRPQFLAPYLEVQVPENSPSGVSLANLDVVDSDEGLNAVVSSFVILDSFAAAVFTIDSSTGSIILKQGQELDREGRFSTLRFQVYAIDSGTPMQFSTAEVQIDITDENDPPQFEDTDYTFILGTPVTVGVPQFSVQAMDPDIGINGEITYSILWDGARQIFSINSTTGDVSVIDSYMLLDSYSITVTATDTGGLEASANLDVLVRSCNFMNLTFAPSSAMITVSVLESASSNSVIVNGSDLQVIDLNIQQGASPDVRFSLPLANPSFEINGQNGDIFVVGLGLDREAQQLHRLVILATDTSDPNRVAQAHVLVTVLDVNDNSPVFNSTTYSRSITSQEPPGNLLQVTATDPDEGSNAELTYSLLNPLNSFSVEPNLGIVSLTSNITQTGTTIELRVRATDRGDPPRSSEAATVFINVLDPRAPRFSPDVYVVTINESTPIGSQIVTVMLHEDSVQSEVSFRFVNIDTTVPFSVSTGGVVSLVDPGVDYEIVFQRNYTLRVRARDSVTGLVGFAIFSVTVTDSNDNAPTFESNSVYTQSIMENAMRGSTVLQVNAVDQDSTPNAIITYQLGSNGGGLFSIVPSSGDIYLSGELDFEVEHFYDLQVLAEDSGSPSLTGTATARINLININDNPPVFSQLVYEASVRDDDLPGSTNLFVSATDPDNLGVPQYNIVPGPGAETFSISGNGRINLAMANPMEDSYNLTVSAFDGMFYGYATVLISVEGVNSNLPVFNQTVYLATVQESASVGLVVAQVFATDADRGTNGQVTYSLQPTELRFSIDSTTGVITTAAGAMMIDREATPAFILVVTAMDGGSFSSNADLSITVEDINDNSPTFNILQYDTTLVTRSAVGTEVVTVSAFDHDSGENGRLIYSIINPAETLIFRVDPSTGVITNFVIPDREIRANYDFFVCVRDNGTIPLSAATNARVVINITEDAGPSFEQDTYSAAILENATIGTTVLQVALDLNSTNSVCLEYTGGFRLCSKCRLSSFASFTSNFMIRGDSIGMATIVTATNDLMVMEYTVIIETECVSRTLEAVQIRTTVNIVVLEVNGPPVFNQSIYSASVMENAINMTLHITEPLMAIDPDPMSSPNGTVMYMLLNNLDKFDITSRTGIILTRVGLDFENETEKFMVRILRVKAFDQGSPSLSDTAIVTVTVTDVNDNPPVFNQSSYSISVAENASINALLHIAEVTDLDANAVHTYTISGTQFSIDRMNGEVRLATLLDRETQANYSVELGASDGINTTSAYLIVSVTDSNDQPPVFNETVYEVEIPENYPTGVTFIQVFATDADQGENAIIIYRQFASNNIIVNSSTGHISFLVSPDHEADAQLSLSIQATDIFNELRSIATVIVRLTDENDNAPVFSRTSYSGNISENLPPWSTVDIGLAQRVEATDRDSGENGTVVYRIEGQGASYLSIVDGEIITQVTFDRETNDSVEILITATDMGSPAMSSNVSVMVQIVDQNDNAPMFNETIYRINVSESVSSTTSIFTARARDLDSGTNGQILLYRIDGTNSDDFRENTEDGVMTIYVRNPLDYEDVRRRVYDLTLIAFDGALMPGNATLIISVIDVNDNVPQFTESVYREIYPENTITNTVLVRVVANDRDANGQAQIMYSIMNAGNYPELSIGALTGEIILATSLDFETTTSYDLTVIASDSAHEVTARVNITVTDINDNPPTFLSHNRTVDILENNNPKIILISLPVEDVDSDPAIISFSIESGNTDNAFDINRMGDLIVLEMLDREMEDLYNLTISAEDNGSPSLTGTTTLLVRVLDVNDNSPTGGHQDIYLYLLNGQARLIPLGEVFVNDSDIINDHRYMLLSSSGADNIRIENNGSIYVSSSSPHVGTYFFTVTITDSGNTPVNTTISALIRNVSEATLTDSFRMQFARIEPQVFVDNHLSSFLTVATSVVNRELSGSVDILPLSIQPSIFPSTQTTDVTLAVQDLADGSYIAPLLIQHTLHINRREIESVLGLTISTVSVDVCSLERCSVGSTCTNRNQESLSSTALGSRSVTYLGITSTRTYDCVPSSPCDRVTCPEPSLCVVVENRRGEITAQCFEDCSSASCKNGGMCIDQNPGYFCVCPEGFDGRNCELTVASFSRDSYAVFQALQSRSFGRISLEFNANGGGVGTASLLYAGRFDDEASDFLFVEFENDTACLSFSYGGGRTRNCLQPSLEDQLWHTLTIEYNTTMISFSAVTYNPYTRREHNTQVQELFHSLDLGAPLFLGRLPAPFGYSNGPPSLLPGFSGCIRNVLVNGEAMDFNDSLAASNIAQGCGCEPQLCKNGGSCFGMGECDCKPEFTGLDCTKDSSTVAFLGKDFINYEILTTTVRPLRRRQARTYSTAQNIISLSFTTDSSSGTLLQLGDPKTISEYTLLKVVDGFIQIQYNLGSGEHILAMGSKRVNDAQPHSVVVTRTEASLEMLLDDKFVNRTISPGDVLLQIFSDDIFLGAEVNVGSGEVVDGFRGCLTGARLDRREFPLNDAGNRNFRVVKFSSGNIISGCPLGQLEESTQPSLYVYSSLGAVIAVLVVVSIIFVTVCGVGGYCWRSRKGEHTIHSRGGSPSHGGFKWQPATYNDRKSPPPADEFALTDSRPRTGMSRSASKTDGGIAETSLVVAHMTPHNPAAQQHNNRPGTQLAPTHSRQTSGQHQVISPPPEGFTAVSQDNPGFLQNSPDTSDHEESRPPNRFVQHMWSVTGQQSIRSTGSAKSDATYIPSELLGMDDAEVTKYIQKKVEIADAENEKYDVDEMGHFNDEGEFEPLGSVGSLYDIVKDLDNDRTSPQQPQTHDKERPASQSKAKPSSISGPAQHPSTRTHVGSKPSLPVKPAGLGKQPVPVIVRTNTSPVKSPPSLSQPPLLPPGQPALARTNTSPIKSPPSLELSPPGHLELSQTKSASQPLHHSKPQSPSTKEKPPLLSKTQLKTSTDKPPLLSKTQVSPTKSPPPLHSMPLSSPTTKSPSDFDPKRNGCWVPVNKHSALQLGHFDNSQQPLSSSNHSGGGRDPKSDPAKLRRSGRRSHRVVIQNKESILEKFHHVTAVGYLGSNYNGINDDTSDIIL